jgi:hypothetical protein
VLSQIPFGFSELDALELGERANCVRPFNAPRSLTVIAQLERQLKG